MPKRNPVFLIILDGYGVNPDPNHPANAIAHANPAYWNSLLAKYPHTTLEPGGTRVGLPEGQFGNSEVGHLNLGAGRVVRQDITQIDHAIETGAFFEKPEFLELLRALPENKKLHLMGLVSDGGVHSSDRHYRALLELCKRGGVLGDRVCFHVITDGRDTPPESGVGFVEALQKHMRELGVGRIASISGRYFAMDRDTNWDRIQRYYDCITLADGAIDSDPINLLELSYQDGVTDEFIPPTFIVEHGAGLGRVESGDSLMFFNFRADRARQICRALTEGDAFDASGFARKSKPAISLLTMTPYVNGLKASVAFPPERPTMTLGETLSMRGISQFRCAETEKYAHITYFFNGGEEEPFEGEIRKVIPSPKVATYDLQPEMSLPAVADTLIEALASRDYGFVLTNFANGDMVGHTGVLDAAIKAVHAIDTHLERVVDAAIKAGYDILITADHGNCDEMTLPDGGTATNHSHNPVPLVLIAQDQTGGLALADGGALENVAPTVLALMGEEQPREMTGESLLLSGVSVK